MANFEDFTKQPWKITSWTIGGIGNIPANGFGHDHHLKMVARLSPRSPLLKLVDLTWKNGKGEECRLQNLSFNEKNGMLHDANIQVSFAGHPLISAEVTFWIDKDGVLRGAFGPPKTDPCQEGNTGTFAADADPPRQEDHGASGLSGRMAPRQEGEHERIRGAAGRA